MRALLLLMCTAVLMLLAGAYPAFGQEDSREDRGRRGGRSYSSERREDNRRERRDREDRQRGEWGVLEDVFRSRNLDVPKGHYPPPGECRMWYPNRPPGQQPPPVPCHRLQGRALGGGFILHGDRAYDANRDWEEYRRRRPGSIPEAILDIILPQRY